MWVAYGYSIQGDNMLMVFATANEASIRRRQSLILDCSSMNYGMHPGSP